MAINHPKECMTASGRTVDIEVFMGTIVSMALNVTEINLKDLFSLMEI